MNIRVRLFASHAEAAGTRDLTLDVPEQATVADLWQELTARFPALADTAAPMPSVHHAYVDMECRLANGDEAAFIPPVSGGAACSR